MNWLISVPCWGERYRRNFINCGLPAIKAALAYASNPSCRWLVQADDPGALRPHLPINTTYLRTPRGKNNALKLGNAVRAAIGHARLGEAILLCNADIIPSREVFAVSESRFAEDKTFITCHSIRTFDGCNPGPGLSGPELSAFGWCYRHVWVEDCIFGRGNVAGPAIVAFANGEDIAVHCFSLYPLAIHKTREIDFSGPTCDELVDAFASHEIHIVTNSSELAIVEPCPDDMPYATYPVPLSAGYIASWAPTYASTMMYWQFRHQIILRGAAQPIAQGIADDILAKVDCGAIPTRLLPYQGSSYRRLLQVLGQEASRWL